jgi:hypothetical protein
MHLRTIIAALFLDGEQGYRFDTGNSAGDLSIPLRNPASDPPELPVSELHLLTRLNVLKLTSGNCSYIRVLISIPTTTIVYQTNGNF